MSKPNHGIATVGIAPLRAESNDRSQMVSQLLLGETVDVLEYLEERKWVQVCCREDDYTGWMNANELRFLTVKQLHKWEQHPNRKRWKYCTQRVFGSQGQGLLIPFGGWILESGSSTNIRFAGCNYPTQQFSLQKAKHPLETALNLRGTPYLWGGRSDVGLDCSGFMQLVSQQHGLSCPRDASQQIALGENITELSSAQPGDWIFFNVQGTGISHVGWYLGDGLLLHASGQVKIQRIATCEKKRFNDLFEMNSTLKQTMAGIRRVHLPLQGLNKTRLDQLIIEHP
ncbi:MAG: NlpC/P60 family protein [Bacteroidota bacterium]